MHTSHLSYFLASTNTCDSVFHLAILFSCIYQHFCSCLPFTLCFLLIVLGAVVPLASSCNGTTHITFESVKHLLCDPVYNALQSMGYTNLTEIQHRVIQSQLSSPEDYRPSIKAIAKTGSGKTLAYLLPLVEMVRALKVKDSTGK